MSDTPPPPPGEPGAQTNPTTERARRAASRREHLAQASVPLRKLIPNLITIAAMCSGVASLHFASKLDPATLNGDDPNLKRAVAAIGMAAILDALDGRAARLLKATSRFGETLDSLSDFVSFGVAPAVLIYRWSQGATTVMGLNLDSVLLLSLVAFAVCSALRLARFTAMQRRKKLATKPSSFFTGLPTPAAAGAALIPPMLMLSDLNLRTPVLIVMAWMLLIALHMISRIPMYSGKGLRVPRKWVLPLMVLIGSVVAAFAHDAWLTASVVCLMYILTMPMSIRSSARARAEAARTPTAPATSV